MMGDRAGGRGPLPMNHCLLLALPLAIAGWGSPAQELLASEKFAVLGEDQAWVYTFDVRNVLLLRHVSSLCEDNGKPYGLDSGLFMVTVTADRSFAAELGRTIKGNRQIREIEKSVTEAAFRDLPPIRFGELPVLCQTALRRATEATPDPKLRQFRCKAVSYRHGKRLVRGYSLACNPPLILKEGAKTETTALVQIDFKGTAWPWDAPLWRKGID
jgi:hypothetical protein